jgi:hypothetical protein
MTTYGCPVHIDEVSDRPGTCPRCGLRLVQREDRATSGHPKRNEPIPEK